VSDSMAWLLILGALVILALAWGAVRLALRVGGDAAAAQTDSGLDHAYDAWATIGPLRVVVDRHWEAGRPRLELWLFGWRALDRELGGTKRRPKTEKSEGPKPGLLSGRVEVDWLELGLWALQRRHLVAVDRARGFVRYGLGDPARTGEVSGLICALAGVLPAGIDLTHEAVFDRDVLEAEGSAALRLFPLPILSWMLWVLVTRVRFHSRRRLKAA
jgi:hypothetical protein